MEHMQSSYLIPNNSNISVSICDSLTSPLHTHDFLELAYVTHGSAVHYMGNKEMTISKGDYFIIDYNSTHSYYSIDNRPFRVINCLFLPEFIDKSLKYCRSFHTLLNHYLIKMNSKNLTINPSNSIFHDKDGKVLEYLQTLLNEFETKQPGYIEMMRCTLIEIIIATMRTFKKSSIDNDDIINSILTYMQENYTKKITLTRIADSMQYSVPYLSNKFKTDVGMGFGEYLEKLRIEEACRLLVNTDRKINDISEAVGYTDTDFFYHIFKKITGKTPGNFRTQ